MEGSHTKEGGGRREEMKAHTIKGFPATPMALNFVLEALGSMKSWRENGTVDWCFRQTIPGPSLVFQELLTHQGK